MTMSALPYRARWVTSVTVDRHGHVSALRNDRGEWDAQNAEDVLTDIELGIHSYWVQWPDRATEVVTVSDSGGVHLATFHPGSTRNELSDLPRQSSVAPRGA